MRKALVWIGILLVTLFSGFTITGAYANSLVSSSPTAGSTINSSPGALTLTTEVTILDVGNTVNVTDPHGDRVDDGTITVNDVDVIAGLKPLNLDGPYTVSYTLLSENDVPLQGTFTFIYKAPSVISSATPTPILTATNSPETVKSGGSVPVLIIGLIGAAFLVFVGLLWYTWNIFKKR